MAVRGFFYNATDLNEKIIYSGENAIPANNINGYLLDAENIFIEKRMIYISYVEKQQWFFKITVCSGIKRLCRIL